MNLNFSWLRGQTLRTNSAWMFDVALVVLAILTSLTYFPLNHAPTGYSPFVLNSYLDQFVPLVPVLIVPYFSFYLYMGFTFGMSLLWTSRRDFHVFTVSYIAISLILCLFYIFFQTYVPRTQFPAGSDPFSALVRFLYISGDEPYNGFPSGHCAFSMLCIIAWGKAYFRMRKWAVVAIVWGLLIIPATVLLKQHYLLDIFGGVSLAITTYASVNTVYEFAERRRNASIQEIC